MAATEQKPVKIKAKEGQLGDGLMQIISYQRGDRIKRAVIAWLGFWTLAVLSIPIIIAHWILIPAFLIAGPLTAYKRMKSEYKPEKVTGKCPVCGEDVNILLESNDTLPMWKYCSNCKTSVNITEETE